MYRLNYCKTSRDIMPILLDHRNKIMGSLILLWVNINCVELIQEVFCHSFSNLTSRSFELFARSCSGTQSLNLLRMRARPQSLYLIEGLRRYDRRTSCMANEQMSSKQASSSHEFEIVILMNMEMPILCSLANKAF